jgi:thiamine biosynthesis lipoprotein
MADHITRCRPMLGTFVEITADCERAIDAGFEAVELAHRLMSAHEPDSDVSSINRFAHLRPVEIDPWTALVLERAIGWSRHSEGAFDIVCAGKSAVENGLVPMHPGQHSPEVSHWTWLELSGSSVRLMRPACIDLGGIAKGFAVDRAVAALKAAGADAGLVNAGGDIGGFGAQAWPVQVVDPQARRAIANVAVPNGAIATSSVLPDGRAWHLPGIAPDIQSATVCAPSAMDAVALTKVVLSGSSTVSRCLRIANARAFVLTGAGAIQSVEPERKVA